MDSPPPLTAEQIQAQMRGIRRDFRDNVKGMVANANQMFDWKSYVRSFPWVSVGVVAAVGYLLVPRRMKVIAYDKAAIEQYLKENQLVVAPPEPPKRSSLIGALLPIVGGVALRFGTTYLTKIGADMLASLTYHHAQPPAYPPPVQNSPPPGVPTMPADPGNRRW